MNSPILIVTTTDSMELAQSIGRALIDARLAACVQISGPITSLYRWKGQVETAEEWYCVAKSVQSHYPSIEACIKNLHTYDEPEIIAQEIIAGSAGYLQWLNQQLRPV